MAAPTAINQLRLMVGDTSADFVWLADETYEWLIETHPVQIDAAIKALEMIINQVALSPQSVQTEDLKETGPMVEALERRLKALKEEKALKEKSSLASINKGFPMIVRSDRSNWDDIDSIFRNC